MHLALAPGKLILLLVLIAMGMIISRVRRYGLERDLLEGTIRTFGQLFLVGLVLNVIFQANHWYWTFLMLLLMILIASQNASRRGRGIPRIFWWTTLAIASGTILTLALLLVLTIIQSTPRYVIPVGGMIIGNSMIASGLVLSRFLEDLKIKRDWVETYLSLGATPETAIQQVLSPSIKSGMIPTLDSMKTVGLVTLPGMMTGAILAGDNPISAVELQIMVMLVLATAVMITSTLLGFILSRVAFTPSQQLINTHPGA
ncbi:putative ABC transport system permease protein [Sulfobacillus thermosulfidooxidans DSM 9293]|uniref:Iron export ABC transporter permease subunit FetB n=2 Tax=Sulfobacillus thermosulfidooxidans TaxID=28034 RepID=A0A2T2X5I7_SULTH|nr:iron export ABC transporter permease subunit FetB [Sulfobacillus thermosulfidooxidans]PSR29771.1 MAG: iron export ABC transporter permease subunit FetB [Sulfobacillus thermosulfidooxidans]SMC07164.1 putative ABC transport system permease protein [Sulfobacillus thermosulfidooxidans DSM 9293]